MLAPVIAIDVIAGTILVLAWYCWFARYNRMKARQVLTWVDREFQGRGRVTEVQRNSCSRFQIQLRLAASPFRQASISVELHPRQLPIHWLIHRVRKQPETLTFRADLDYPPCFNLEVHNHRWLGRSRRRLSRGWGIERAGPFVLTTRTEWQREITGMMGALLASRECECMRVSFSRTSPHFLVTVPLAVIFSSTRPDIFDVLRELAAGAASARF